MEVMVGPSLSIEYVLERPPEDEALLRCPLHPGEEEAGGSRKGVGFRSSRKSLGEESSESSSSIGGPEDSDEEEEEEEHVAVSSGGMASLISLDDALPVKRGLSNHYSGKSKSFANLSEVSWVTELKKEEKAFNKRRRVLMANKWYLRKKANSFYSWQNPKSMPLLALNEEEGGDRQPSASASSSSSSPRTKSQSCFSLSDLQEEDQL